MKVRFTAAARRELADAIEYYEGRQTHLGERFLAAVEATAERIKRHPRMWASVSSNVRRCLVPGFPFALFYRVSEPDVHILAVADLRRDPQRWEQLM